MMGLPCQLFIEDKLTAYGRKIGHLIWYTVTNTCRTEEIDRSEVNWWKAVKLEEKYYIKEKIDHQKCHSPYEIYLTQWTVILHTEFILTYYYKNITQNKATLE